MEDSDQANNNNEFIIRTNELNFKPSAGLGVELFRLMKFFGKNVAQFLPDTREVDTYSSLLQRCIRTSLKMQSEGLTQNDIVFICSYNHKNSCIPFISAAFLGLRVASLDPSMSTDDISHLFKQVTPSIVFCVEESIELIRTSLENAQIVAKLVVFGENSTDFTNFNEYLEKQDGEDMFEPVRVEPSSTAVIFFSSGTTGLPKGICMAGYGLMVQAVNMINNGAVTAVNLYYSSLYWISAVIFLISAMTGGLARVVTRDFDPIRIWHLIQEYRVSFVFLAPIQAVAMLKVGRPDALDTSSLLSLTTGGGSFSGKHQELLKDLLPGTIITQAYGQTEVAGLLTAFCVNDVKDCLLSHYKPNSCGRPVPGMSYKIVDPETGCILGPNQKGELLVKSKCVMNGYYNMESSSCFDAEGWLKTGDLVYYDEDLCFYVVDRIKELLKYKSWHIPPTLLENVLNAHPDISKAVVVGIPHEEDGDHAMAVVILNEDAAQKVSAEEIEEYVAGRVADRQRLRAGVVFVDEFPITPSGKIKRGEVKKMALDILLNRAK